MVLLFSHAGDALAVATHAKLRRDGLSSRLIDAALHVSAVELTWYATATPARGRLSVGDDEISFEDLSSVLVRTLDLLVPEPGMEEVDRHYVRAEVRAAFHALLECLPCPIVNRPSAPVVRRPFLFAPGALAAVRDVGLRPADALVTSDVEESVSFLAGSHGLVGSLTDRCSPRPLGTVPLAETLLAQRPAYVVRVPIGGLLRLYFVGTAVAGAERAEERSPWREVAVPLELAAQAGELVRRLGLSFAQVTFGDGPAWETCLDVNAFPNLEDAAETLRGRVVAELARLLAGGGTE